MIILNYDEVLNKINSWTEELSEYQLKRYKDKNFHVYSKDSVIDFYTEVDVQSEKLIISHIKANFPDHSILGEETGAEKTPSEYQWIIDPIDGTTNYIHGYPMYTISIALKYKDEMVIGLVYAPVIKFKFTAIKDQGAYLNGNKISVSSTKALINSLLATGFQYKRAVSNTNLKYFNELINKISDIRRSGSAALDICMVAASFLDGFWEFDLKEWDFSAGELILKEAGGKVFNGCVEGHPLFVCGNPHIHDKLLLELEDIAKI